MSVYLDNAATSYPKPPGVAEAVFDFMNNVGASAGRGAYERAIYADAIVYRTRKNIVKLFNFDSAKNVIFTSNVTEALNLAIRGILKTGDHVVTSSMEHNAVWRCLKTLEEERGVEISPAPCSKEGYTNPEDVKHLIGATTRLVVFNHASNVLGTVQPIKEIGAAAEKKGVPFLVDTAQTAGVYPIDIYLDNIALLAFTGHKGLLGPMGTGGLIINSDIKIEPLKFGGTGGDSLLEHQPDYLPDRFEAGTPNVSGIAGLNAALEFILEIGVEAIREKEKNLVTYALRRLKEIKGVEIFGPDSPDERVGVISFNVSDIPPEEIAYVLDKVYGVMVRAGLHCSPCAHKIIGTEKKGTVRLGIGYFNQEKDIDLLVSGIREITSKI